MNEDIKQTRRWNGRKKNKMSTERREMSKRKGKIQTPDEWRNCETLQNISAAITDEIN